MNRRAGRLIAIEGIDGAGKTTLMLALARAFEQRGWPHVLVNKNTTELPGEPALSQRLRAVNALVYARSRGQDGGEAWGDHHWLFLLAAWFSLLDRCVVRPALARGQHVLVDNGSAKILARYLVDGAFPGGLARAVFADLARPDLAMLLDLDPAGALARKGEFSPMESGFAGEAESAFVRYQSRVRKLLTGFAAAEGWAIVDVADRSPDEVLTEALGLVEARLGLADRSDNGRAAAGRGE